MKIRSLVLGLAATAALALPAQAVTVGSFDASRIFTAPQVVTSGAKRADLRGTIAANGDTVGAATSTLTAGYLAGVEVFVNSALSNTMGILSAAEQSALVDWVNAGGVLLSTGEVSFFRDAYESFLDPFGIAFLGSFAGPRPAAVWSSDPANPFLAKGVGGSAMTGVNGVSIVFDGTASFIASDGLGIIGVSKQVGRGYVVAIGDSNFLDSGAGYSATTDQFVRNVLDTAPGLAAVPLPAGGLLLIGALGMLATRRRRAA